MGCAGAVSHARPTTPPAATSPWDAWASTEADDALHHVAAGPDRASYATGRDRLGAFVARFGPDGARSWRHTLHGVPAGSPPSVAVAPTGEVYVAGGFEGRFRVGATAFAARGRKDIFLLRLDAAGELVWGRQYGGARFETVHGLAADARGVYLAGTYQDELELGGVTLGNGRDFDGFIAKLDARGAHVWSARFQDRGEISSRVNALALGPDGDVYATGILGRDVNLEGRPPRADVSPHAFVARLAQGGAFRWLRALDATGRAEGTSIALGPDGRVLVAGHFEGTLDVEGAPTARRADIFVAAWSGSGTRRWARALGSEGLDVAYAVATDDAGDVFVAGRVAGEVRGGDGAWPAAGVDGLVARFDHEGAPRGHRLFSSDVDDEVRDLRVGATGFLVVGSGGALTLASARRARDASADGFIYGASLAALAPRGPMEAPRRARPIDEPGGALPARALPARVEAGGNHIRIALTSEDRSMAPAAFTVEGGAWHFEGQSSAEGVVEFLVPEGVSPVTLSVPALGAAYTVNIGDLDPIDEPSGAAERLTHLGLWGTYGDEAPGAALDPVSLRRAVEMFQRDRSLPVTGRLDLETLDALLRAHGS